MLRYIRYLILAAIAVCLVTIAMANRGPVTLRLVPAEVTDVIGIGGEITLPLYLVILGGVVLGVLLGFVWEWIREAKIRSSAAQDRREREKLEREVTRIKAKNPAASDDVLAILENGSRAT